MTDKDGGVYDGCLSVRIYCQELQYSTCLESNARCLKKMLDKFITDYYAAFPAIVCYLIYNNFIIIILLNLLTIKWHLIVQFRAVYLVLQIADTGHKLKLFQKARGDQK